MSRWCPRVDSSSLSFRRWHPCAQSSCQEPALLPRVWVFTDVWKALVTRHGVPITTARRAFSSPWRWNPIITTIRLGIITVPAEGKRVTIDPLRSIVLISDNAEPCTSAWHIPLIKVKFINRVYDNQMTAPAHPRSEAPANCLRQPQRLDEPMLHPAAIRRRHDDGGAAGGLE